MSCHSCASATVSTIGFPLIFSDVLSSMGQPVSLYHFNNNLEVGMLFSFGVCTLLVLSKYNNGKKIRTFACAYKLHIRSTGPSKYSLANSSIITGANGRNSCLRFTALTLSFTSPPRDLLTGWGYPKARVQTPPCLTPAMRSSLSSLIKLGWILSFNVMSK